MARVRHILADGREVDSIEGFVIPMNGPTAAVYHIAVEFYKNHPELIRKKKEETSNASTV